MPRLPVLSCYVLPTMHFKYCFANHSGVLSRGRSATRMAATFAYLLAASSLSVQVKPSAPALAGETVTTESYWPLL